MASQQPDQESKTFFLWAREEMHLARGLEQDLFSIGRVPYLQAIRELMASSTQERLYYSNPRIGL